MRRSPLVSVSLVVLAALMAGRAVAEAPAAGIDAKYGVLPLAFEPNRGQTHKDVKFFTRGPGYQFFLTQKEAVFVFIQREMPPEDPAKPYDRIARARARREAKVTKSVVRMKFEGARKQVKLAGEDPLPGKTNYFIGNDPKKWRTDIPTYRKVRLTGAYQGIDVVFYGNGRHIEYDLVVQPGIDPGRVRVKFDGLGAIEKGDDGNLRIATAAGALEIQRPYLYQEIEGRKVEVAGSYVFDGRRTLAFSVKDYDPERALVIDPQLVYSTYIGGSGGAFGGENPQVIAIDTSGNAVLAGTANSPTYPTTAGAFLEIWPGVTDVPYLTKLNADGSALVFSTWIGGTYGDDGCFGIALDTSANVFITGNTNSPDFPITPGAFQNQYRAIFLTKIAAGGNALIYSTFLGGQQHDAGFGIVAGGDGSAYVIGSVIDDQFPTTIGAFQTAVNHSSALGAGFVARVAPSGSSLLFSTYLNGTISWDGPGSRPVTFPSAVHLDSSGNVVVTGGTNAKDFPTTPGTLAPTSSGSSDFVIKLSSGGSTLVAGTYVPNLPGSLFGPVPAAFDSADNVYLGYAAGVTKVSADLSQMVYQTSFFSSPTTVARGIAVDSAGAAFVIGFTMDSGFPTTPGAFLTQFHGAVNGFLTRLTPSGLGVSYSTLLGGQNQQLSDYSYAQGVAVNAGGDAHVCGHTSSSAFLTTPGSFQRVFAGGMVDSFVVKLHPTTILPTPAISPATGPSLGGTPVTITGSGFQSGAAVTLGGVRASVQSIAPSSIQATTGAHPPGLVDLLVANPDDSIAVLANAYTYTCGTAAPTATVSGTISICTGGSTNLSVALTGTGPWTLNWADGFVQSGISSSLATRSVSPSSTTTYSISTVADANCAGSGSGSATVTVNPVPSATITAPAAVCQNASNLGASVPNAGGGATYLWTITNGTITSGAGTNAIVFSAGVTSPIQLGVTVTRGGCSKAGTANVSVTPVATAAVSGSASICAGASTTIQAALTGVAPWTVTWSDGVVQSGVAASPATRSVTPAASTSYSVTAVTDATGCAGTHSGLADIVVKPAPPALITPTAAQVCPGSAGNIASTVDAGAGATYAWTVTNGAITAGAGTRQITFTAGAPGSNVVLAVTTTASNGCTSTDTRVWTVLAAPSAALSGPTTACSGQPTNLNVNLAGQPPWNLRWSDGLVQIIQASPATRVVTLAADASFSLTSLTDGAGCTGSVSGNVSIAVRQSASAVISGGGTVCAGDAATISAAVTSASPFSARWSDGVIQSGPGSTTLTRVVRPFGSTVYKIDAIFDGTCTSVGSGSALVNVGLEPSAAIVTAPGSVCAGASGGASVPDAGAAASYTWSIRNGTIDGGQGTRSVTFTAGDESPARLTVLVQAGSGCQVSGFWDVIVNRRPQAPALTAPAKAVSGDFGLVASVPGGGSDVFLWTVENGTLTSGQGTSAITFSAGLPGVTTVRVVQKTANGCSSEAAVLNIPVSGLSATRIVPVVVSVGGNGGAQFRSELTLTNPGGSNAHVDLTLTPADSLGGGAGSTVGQDIGPGRQLVIPDALAFFAGQGALRAAQSAAAAGGGSVRAVFTNLPAKALVYGGARTTAVSGAGRAGLAYPAPAAEDFFNVPVAVYGLRETAAERSNLALENAGTSGAIGLRVTLVSGTTNARFVLPENVFLQPGQWYQIGSVLKAAGFTSGWALVERVSGTNPYYAYGVANDNLTNDGAFLAAVPAARAASAQVVPSIVETPAFGTELLLVNPGSASATATLNFIESLASPLGNSTGFVTETLKAGEQRFIPDLVAYLRAKGASPGAKGASYAGPLFVRFTAGGAAVDGYVASRTSAPAAGGGGYGVSYAGVALAETASSSAWVFGLQQNTASRSNLGLLNAATNLGTITLRYDVYDGATGSPAGGATVSLYPGQWTQVNTILKTFGLTNGYVRVTRTAGTAPWVAYGVVNDGSAPGAGTGDGSFIGMTTAP